MYVWLWQRLPGAWPFKVLQCLALATVSVALLFFVVFPWIEPRLPFTDVTVDEEGGAGSTPTATAPATPGAPAPVPTPGSPGTAPVPAPGVTTLPTPGAPGGVLGG